MIALLPSLLARQWVGPQTKWRVLPQSVSGGRCLAINVCGRAHCGSVRGFLAFWLQVTIALIHHSVFDNTVDSRYLEFRKTLKHFEISVPRHIRFAEFRKQINRTNTFNKCVCNLTSEFRDILKILWKSGENAPFCSFPQYMYFVTCC